MYILGIVDKYKKTVKSTFDKKVEHFEQSYSSFLALLERLYPDKLYNMIQNSLSDLSVHKKYGVFYRHFVRAGDVDVDRPILAMNQDFLFGHYSDDDPKPPRFYSYNVNNLLSSPILI